MGVGCWSCDLQMQMKEEELIHSHHVGDVINILQKTTHHLFDPDELLTVKQFSLPLFIYNIFLRSCCLFCTFIGINQ